MPAQEYAFRRAKAVIWLATGFNEYGQYTRASASIELSVRWVDSKIGTFDSKGNNTDAMPSMETGRSLPLGSVVYRGSLDDLANEVSGTGTGTDVTPADGVVDLYEVYRCDETPDLKGRNSFWRVSLRPLSQAIPSAG